MASSATEELYKLESVDIAESKCNISRMRKRLDNDRDPALLGELVEFYLAKGSKQALAVLTAASPETARISMAASGTLGLSFLMT